MFTVTSLSNAALYILFYCFTVWTTYFIFTVWLFFPSLNLLTFPSAVFSFLVQRSIKFHLIYSSGGIIDDCPVKVDFFLQIGAESWTSPRSWASCTGSSNRRRRRRRSWRPWGWLTRSRKASSSRPSCEPNSLGWERNWLIERVRAVEAFIHT